MKRSRFSEEQIIAILKEQESGVSTADGRPKLNRSKRAAILQTNGSFRGHQSERGMAD
jgi:hypothetical protein